MNQGNSDDVPVRPRRKSGARRSLFGALYVFYVVLLAGIAVRGFLWWVYSVPPVDFSNRVDACQLHYPELTSREILSSRRSGERLEVLLLGGSVAEQTGLTLEQRLAAECRVPVRVHNAAVSAHTTRDSLNKLECLIDRGAEFDIILVYHGINDVRMNCVAAEDFRPDYTHCGWYASFQQKKLTGRMSAGDTVKDSLNRMIGLGAPDEDHVAFGAEIKTGPAFRNHMAQIIALSRSQNTPAVLMSFATHFVNDYSREALEAGQLGYAKGQYALGTEVWGDPENVRRGVEVHNEMIRELAKENRDLIFIDIADKLSEVQQFCDVCHLSPEGVQDFAEVVSVSLSSLLRELSQKHGH